MRWTRSSSLPCAKLLSGWQPCSGCSSRMGRQGVRNHAWNGPTCGPFYSSLAKSCSLNGVMTQTASGPWIWYWRPPTPYRPPPMRRCIQAAGMVAVATQLVNRPRTMLENAREAAWPVGLGLIGVVVAPSTRSPPSARTLAQPCVLPGWYTQIPLPCSSPYPSYTWRWWPSLDPPGGREEKGRRRCSYCWHPVVGQQACWMTVVPCSAAVRTCTLFVGRHS